MHCVWKLLKISHLNLWILAFYTIFCPIKSNLSGNTVWPQASDFQDQFLTFLINFYLLKNVNIARSARNVEWEFLWFSNMVYIWQLRLFCRKISFLLGCDAAARSYLVQNEEKKVFESSCTMWYISVFISVTNCIVIIHKKYAALFWW